MPELILATGNPHKVEELRAIFATLPGAQGWTILGLKDLPGHEHFTEPHEHGTTFEENATIKALSYAEQTGRLCLADDSGLEIDALGGRPGVISSHYSTDGHETGLTRPQRDRLNNQRVLKELEGVPPERRSARFVCVMAVAPPPRSDQAAAHKPPFLVRGTFEGRVGLPGQVPRGQNGFGYDPLFLVAPDFTRTGAELPAPEKNLLSHRASAARLLAARLHLLR
jgi:XTP/dITP diphosphohydrolase